MTLLLGPPSSGKTTLLLALAGKLAKELKVKHRFVSSKLCFEVTGENMGGLGNELKHDIF